MTIAVCGETSKSTNHASRKSERKKERERKKQRKRERYIYREREFGKHCRPTIDTVN